MDNFQQQDGFQSNDNRRYLMDTQFHNFRTNGDSRDSLSDHSYAEFGNQSSAIWDRITDSRLEDPNSQRGLSQFDLMGSLHHPQNNIGDHPQGLPPMNHLGQPDGGNQMWQIGEQVQFPEASQQAAIKMAMAMNDVNWRGNSDRRNDYMHSNSGFLNSKGLPLRPGELECSFYLKSGSCKYGATCKYHHPEVIGGHIGAPVLGMNFNQDANPALWMPNNAPLPNYPERPGQQECAYYMKTGSCKYGVGCKFHHPRLRPPYAGPNSVGAGWNPTNVKLTMAGFPRREGETPCAYYMKTGTCKYGVTCKFDHPPPGEAAAMAAAMAGKKEGGEGQEAASAEPAGEQPLWANQAAH